MAQGGERKRYKIGEAAAIIGVSVPTLRMYEREGILIPWKSPSGTRYFSDEDLHWIGCIRRMLGELGLNIEGIRRLLALIPCWELRPCKAERRRRCPHQTNGDAPCWTIPKTACRVSIDDCHQCAAYRHSVTCENLKSLFQIRLKKLSGED